MKFQISTDQFVRSVRPAADIALKNVKKDKTGEKFHYAGFLTIEASPNVLNIKAHGGTASIIVRVGKAEDYIPEETGARTVRALELVGSLKSFSLTDQLVITAEGDQLKLTLESDQQTFIALRTSSDLIKCPRIPKIFAQESVVDRQCFVGGMQKVAFAMAEDEIMHSYMSILYESWKNRMRFSAGTGGRFAIIDFDGDGQRISSDETRIIFPRRNVSNIIRIFKHAPQPILKVKFADPDVRNNIPEQVVIENDSITLALYDFKYLTKYPNLNEMINRNYAYQISTRITDWKHVIEAIKATFCFFEKKKIHNTKITADLLHGYFNIQTITEMQMKRRVDFEPGIYVIDTAKDKNYKPWFRCNSIYLIEMVTQTYKDGILIINFEDQAKLDEYPDGKPKQMEPILIKYPERKNKDGIKEKYFMLFTVSSKE